MLNFENLGDLFIKVVQTPEWAERKKNLIIAMIYMYWVTEVTLRLLITLLWI